MKEDTIWKNVRLLKILKSMLGRMDKLPIFIRGLLERNLVEKTNSLELTVDRQHYMIDSFGKMDEEFVDCIQG